MLHASIFCPRPYSHKKWSNEQQTCKRLLSVLIYGFVYQTKYTTNFSFTHKMNYYLYVPSLEPTYTSIATNRVDFITILLPPPFDTQNKTVYYVQCKKIINKQTNLNKELFSFHFEIFTSCFILCEVFESEYECRCRISVYQHKCKQTMLIIKQANSSSSF